MTPAELRALKDRLPRTWPAFFERHGSFTAAQRAGIPPLLGGEHLLLCAPTAGGKTAAVLAPLIERYCPPLRAHDVLRILYIVPTRALASDLQSRLAQPLETLGVSLGVKTGDRDFGRERPPDVLLTTPESLDALLATDARLFAPLRALVIDELHVFDATPRGDQLQALLARLRRLRAYAAQRGDAADDVLHYAALSATIDEPEAVVARYFGPARVVRVAGGRPVLGELIALAAESHAALHDYLGQFRARGWRKALAFCNSRAEVERYTAAVRAAGSFGGAVYTHYSNLEPRRRREIESEYAEAEAAICFTSSTLELGIDIGTIDTAILIGPPGSPASFAQRIGRANRRGGSVPVACCYRSSLERVCFEALLREAGRETGMQPGEHDAAPPVSSHSFRPAVLVQQIFSLLKQSPTAALRLAELRELFGSLIDTGDVEAIVGELAMRGYLAAGRPGEWRAGPRLNRLIDEQGWSRGSPSIHSTIQTGDAAQLEIRDQHTGRAVARVDALWTYGEALTLEGRPINITWSDGEALWVTSQRPDAAAQAPIFRSARQLLSYELARLLPAQLGLDPWDAPVVAAPDGYWWFHCLGDLYGRAVLDLLGYTVPTHATGAIGLAVLLSDPPRSPPSWSETQVERYLSDQYRRYEPLLDLGAFHQLAPPALRRRAVVAQFDVPRFLQAVAALRPLVAPEDLAEELEQLMAAG